ncbi:subtilisin-like protein [Lepidopterella palustris CBS 459.81]|uniref:tripeptidyl-peptidase II n=1 Tax=Lepidopterella palustris CBS 459.81 TaxID=1314670 RepID=A0A8E2E4D4_9PEZI|nr:subtilisin-like protein [Lepidopterella palustris CBS 459.81]
MFRFLLSFLLFQLVLTSAVKSRSSYAVKDINLPPVKWSRLGPAPIDHSINLRIGLKQSKVEELERHLYEVSDPEHDRYGQHLSADEVNELIKPTEESLELVHAWLLDHDIALSRLRYTATKDMITVTLPLESVEELLDTKYSVFENDEGVRLVRTPEWSLPLHLHEHIRLVQPTNSFFHFEARRGISRRSTKVRVSKEDITGAKHKPVPSAAPPANSTVAAVCGNFSSVTPDCLRTIYGTKGYTPRMPGKNQVALCDYLGELNLRTDVQKYLQLYRPEAVSAADGFLQVSIAGGTVQQTALNATELENETGIEGNLDAETILGISWPTPMTAYSTGGLNPTFMPDNFTTSDSDEPYLVWLDYVLSLKSIPQTISTSYGDDEQTVSRSYAREVCNQFMQLGARGVSVLFASGDYGVGATGYCSSNDGLGTPEFLPGFPNDCPYVTNVGATTGYPEVAALDPRFHIPFTSGAGFSNYFPMPEYQKRAVESYIKSLDGLHDGLYNKSGRAYPDIAAQGQNFAVVWNGTVIPVDGTSAATPAAAGVITLVNDALITAGRKPLGFLNPWLYSGGWKAFTDVTSGSSAGCNTTGFPAKKGWDAVTGWGTPYFPDILEALKLGNTTAYRKM